MRKAVIDASREGCWAGQDRSMPDPREANEQKRSGMERKMGGEEVKTLEQGYSPGHSKPEKRNEEPSDNSTHVG